MDDVRFDALARTLGGQRSRRGALRLAGIGALAGVLPSLVAAPDTEAQEFRGQACKPVGTRCGRRRRGRGRKSQRRQPHCTKCCTRYTITQRNGQRRCSCMPDLTPCRRSDQCCSGFCLDPSQFPELFPPGGEFTLPYPICVPGFLLGIVG